MVYAPAAIASSIRAKLARRSQMTVVTTDAMIAETKRRDNRDHDRPLRAGPSQTTGLAGKHGPGPKRITSARAGLFIALKSPLRVQLTAPDIRLTFQVCSGNLFSQGPGLGQPEEEDHEEVTCSTGIDGPPPAPIPAFPQAMWAFFDQRG